LVFSNLSHKAKSKSFYNKVKLVWEIAGHILLIFNYLLLWLLKNQFGLGICIKASE